MAAENKYYMALIYTTNVTGWTIYTRHAIYGGVLANMSTDRCKHKIDYNKINR